MDKEPLYKGRISFINHEKGFATIEYLHNNKEKSVNFKMITGKGKKAHQFRMGDGVEFRLRLSDRGDKMAAYDVEFKHNTGISLLIQKAKIENRFSGYLKKVDNEYFVKEWESYILFPLKLSPWEIPPVETANNEAISFSLLNLDKPNGMIAELFSHNYTAAYKKAVQHFKNEIDVEATITRISPHAVFIDLFDGGMQAKLALPDIGGGLNIGDSIQVLITYLTPYRVVVKRVGQ